MGSESVANFVKQQGFPETSEGSCPAHFKALNFQPTAIAPLVLLGIILQSAPLFLVLGAIQVWNVVVPRLNVFDIVYNKFVAGRSGATRLTPAPAPRRFSMGMAAAFMLGIGASLVAGLITLAIVLQVFLVVALSAILLGKFCLGSYIYHLIRGQSAFANRTLPWSEAGSTD